MCPSLRPTVNCPKHVEGETEYTGHGCYSNRKQIRVEKTSLLALFRPRVHPSAPHAARPFYEYLMRHAARRDQGGSMEEEVAGKCKEGVLPGCLHTGVLYGYGIRHTL